jgi:diguanylate cyclase (GGDEF)-like protein
LEGWPVVLAALGIGVIVGIVAGFAVARLARPSEKSVRNLRTTVQELQASRDELASVAIENVLLHRDARHLSLTDPLTGVWNRRYLQMILPREIDRATRFGRPLSLLMLDIDRFKPINDRWGHQRGDKVLVELIRRLGGSTRSQIDTVVRYGGEEFVVVLPETPARGARFVAEKLRMAVREEPFAGGDGEPLNITVSVGIASYPEDGATADDLVGAADLALYRAKAAGRDRVESPA